MIKKYFLAFLLPLVLMFLFSCKKKIKQQEDEIYSRHLQRQVKLTIISTPMPGDKSEMNLLILNDGQDLGKFRVKEILDSLYKKKLINPLIIVGIIAGDRIKEFGVSQHPDFMKRGDKADNYAAFIEDELYAYAKKNAGVRKFKSVVLAGCSLGGLSAFDIAWDNADKIDKVGVFSGSFLFTDKSVEDPGYSDINDRILLNKIKSSHKKPHLKYWFYGDDSNENGLRYHDSISINHTKDLIASIKNKKVCSPGDIVYTEHPNNGIHDYALWSNQLPAFLLWAFGK